MDYRVVDIVRRHARSRGDQPALIAADARVTWAELDARANRVGQALRAMEVGPGDRIAHLDKNSIAYFELLFGAGKVGAVLVDVNWRLVAREVGEIVDDAQAKLLVAGEEFRTVAEQVASARELPLIVGGAAYESWIADQPADDPGREPAEDEIALQLYTSGTTGLPKGIMHTHFVRSMYCTLMGAAFRMTPESRTLHTGAIVFNGAFVTMMPTFHLGATYILLRQFDPQATIAAIEHERVTHVMLVPAQIVALLDSPRFDAMRLASLECILSLGAPLLQEHKDRLNAALPGRFYELYGLTEGFVTILDRDDAVRKSGSVGVPPPFYRMRIEKDDGADAAPGDIGEIAGRGPILMTGYYKRPDLTAQAIRDGWLYSGDMGYMDDEGYLHLVDRKKDMIDSGGVKVYPRDIEEIAARHPDVREVAVLGIPHDKWGETPLAAVILREGASTGAAQLRDWINERVGARYQRVSEVVIMADFPRSAAGKTLKRELREPYWAGRGRKI